MKNTYFIIFWLLLAIFAICTELKAQTLGDFQTNNAAVTFGAATGWQRHNGTSFVAAAAAPTSSDGVITIRNGHTATVGGATTTTLDQVVVQSGGSLVLNAAAATLNISQTTIQSGGTLTHSNGTFIIANGAGDDIIVENGGTFVLGAGSEPTFAVSATMLIKTGGILRANTNNGNADSFASDDVVAYTGKTTFEDGAIFEWNTTAFNTTGITYFPNANATTIPIFRIISNVGTIGSNSTTTINGVLEVNGSVTWQNDGLKVFRNGIMGTGTITQASSTMSPFGQFQITGTNAKLGGTGIIILNSTNINSGLRITSTAEVTLTSNKIINEAAATNPTVTVAGILDCGVFNLTTSSGTPNFTLNSAATLKMGSPQGITSSGATGNIQLAGIRTFNGGANYEYKGTAAQVTGNGLGFVVTSVPLNAFLTINNSSGVTQSNASHTIDGGQMILTAGTYNLSGKSFTWQNSNMPITRTGGTLTTNNATNLTFGTSGNLLGNTFTLPNDLFVAPTTLNNFTVDRTNNLILGNQGFSVVGTLSVGANGVADLDLNGNNIDLGSTGTLSEQRGLSRVVFDNTVTDFDAIKGGFIRATSRNLNGTDIAGLGIDITNGTAGTVTIDRYHCKVKGNPDESIKKVFDITASVAANNATMTINYSPQDLVGTTLSDATANFRLHRGKSGVISPWTMQTSPAAIATCHVIGARTVFADNIISFSPWTAAPEITILPVNLVFFKATKQQNSLVELTWQTATEENHDTFEIQKSIYGDNFITIAFVKNIDKQNSNIVKNYSFLDNQCLQTSYYRLKQIDNDGKFTYSKIEAIAMDLSDNQIFAITPNPFANKVTINTSLAKDTFVSIYLTDLLGVSLENFEGKLADIEIKLCKRIENLPSGVYLISVWNGQNKIVQKIIKL